MCTGYGGLDLAALAVYGGDMGWCADNDAHATVLLHRRFPQAPNIGDLTEVDWSQVPAVDIVTAGFPCQDISFAGRGAGIRKGTRSGVWLSIADALRVLRPGLVLLENVAALRARGLATVLGGLAALGYDTAWMCLRASDIGAPHRRDRMFIAAAHPAIPRIPREGLPTATEEGRTSGQSVRRGLRGTAAHPHGMQCQRRRASELMAGPHRPATAQPGEAAQHRRATPADPASQRPRLDRTTLRHRIPAPAVHGAAPDAEGQRRHQGQPEPARLQRRPDPSLSRTPDLSPAVGVDWGPYGPAIHRWEELLGRPAPQPTETGTRGQPRLSARFVEWMMGLPAGWVTDLPLTRTAQMRLLGNGVVPQQAILAFRELDDRLHAERPGPGRCVS